MGHIGPQTSSREAFQKKKVRYFSFLLKFPDPPSVHKLWSKTIVQYFLMLREGLKKKQKKSGPGAHFL